MCFFCKQNVYHTSGIASIMSLILILCNYVHFIDILINSKETFFYTNYHMGLILKSIQKSCLLTIDKFIVGPPV